MSELLQKVAANLRRRSFEVLICHNREEAVQLLDQRFLSSPNVTIGIGNSMTLRELDLPAMAQTRGCEVHARSPENMSNEDAQEALTADIYFASANALSEDGCIVNIDGTGNRVGATCFGPPQVVFVIGRNKITPDLPSALARAKSTAVKLAQKYRRKTPCAVTGKCNDCLSPESICGVTTIHRKALAGNRICVILVDEDLGL